MNSSARFLSHRKFQQIHILLHKSVAIGFRRDIVVSGYQWEILRYASCIMVMRVKLVRLT